MDVKLWSHLSAGRKVTFKDVPTQTADRMFNQHKALLHDPFVTYYRVTLEDPDRGDYVVRDSDKEVYGIGGHNEPEGRTGHR